MNLSSILYLIGTILLVLAAFTVQLGDIPMVTSGLAFLGAGLFFESTTWNRSLDGRVR